MYGEKSNCIIVTAHYWRKPHKLILSEKKFKNLVYSYSRFCHRSESELRTVIYVITLLHTLKRGDNNKYAYTRSSRSKGEEVVHSQAYYRAYKFKFGISKLHTKNRPNRPDYVPLPLLYF